MADDDDDDVVFENSALYNHLKGVGFIDGDICAEPKNVPTEETEVAPSSETNPEKKYNFVDTVKSGLASYVWDTVHKRELHQLHQKEAEGLVDLVLQSPVLEEEDAICIDSFSRSLSHSELTLPATDESDGPMTQVITQMGIIGIALAYACFRMIYMKSDTASSQLFITMLDILSVLLTIAALLPNTVRAACGASTLRSLTTFRRHMANLHQDICLWNKLNKRCVRLIQETELVSRGFTMVSGRVLNSDSASCQRQCPALRRQLFLSIRQVLLTFKSSTASLISKFPSHVELEGVANYLAHRPLSDYGPCFTAHTDDQLHSVTDAYCLTAIKGLLELCNTHISEFLRVLTMACLLHEENLIQFGFSWQLEVTQSTGVSLRGQYTPLHRAYLLHKTVAETEARGEKSRSSPQSPLQSVLITVHSLALHLHAALHRTQATDNHLDKLVEDGEETLTPDLLTQLTSDLDRVKNDLEACKDCWDETRSRLNRMTFNQGCGGESSDEEREDGEERVEETVTLIDPHPALIEDQVFEGYSDPVDVSGDDQLDDITREEKARLCREQEEAVRMLKELRTVIAVRAEDTREREKRALLRGAQHTPSDKDGENDPQQDSMTEVPANDLHTDNPLKPEDLINPTKCPTEYLRDEGPIPTEDLQNEGHIKSEELTAEGEGQFTSDLAVTSRLSHKPLCGSDLLSQQVAAMVAARSQQMAVLTEDTFGADGEMEEAYLVEE